MGIAEACDCPIFLMKRLKYTTIRLQMSLISACVFLSGSSWRHSVCWVLHWSLVICRLNAHNEFSVISQWSVRSVPHLFNQSDILSNFPSYNDLANEMPSLRPWLHTRGWFAVCYVIRGIFSSVEETIRPSRLPLAQYHIPSFSALCVILSCFFFLPCPALPVFLSLVRAF